MRRLSNAELVEAARRTAHLHAVLSLAMGRRRLDWQRAHARTAVEWARIMRERRDGRGPAPDDWHPVLV